MSDVFLASRFEEFSEVRRELRDLIGKYRAGNVRLCAVDLNDGRASSRSTLEECLRCVESSQFMILLLGRTYGALAPGHDKSFTELEFDHAVSEAAATCVLAFRIGNGVAQSDDPRVAAFERNEARRAIRLGDYAPAITHLRRALTHRPQELKSNYWLALLYIALGRRDLLSAARQMAERAARIAESNRASVRAAHCLKAAAHAARRSGEIRQGLQLANRAVELAPGYAFTHLERARQLVALGDHAEALAEVRSAARRRGHALRQAWSDPALRPIRAQVKAMAEQMQQQQLGVLQRLVQFEERMCGATSCQWPRGDESLQQLIYLCRASANRQRSQIASLIAEAELVTERTVAGARCPDDVPSEMEQARQRLRLSSNALRESTSTLFGVGFAVILVSLSVFGFGVSSFALVWATLASVVVLSGAHRGRVAAARESRDAEARLGQLSFAQGSQERVHSIVYDFRRTVLSGELRSAFRSAYRARRGDVVAMDPTRRASMEERLGCEIILQRNLPMWLAAGGEDVPSLFRVVSSSDSALVLDERAGYR